MNVSSFSNTSIKWPIKMLQVMLTSSLKQTWQLYLQILTSLLNHQHCKILIQADTQCWYFFLLSKINQNLMKIWKLFWQKGNLPIYYCFSWNILEIQLLVLWVWMRYLVSLKFSKGLPQFDVTDQNNLQTSKKSCIK